MELIMLQSNLEHHQHAYLRSVKDKVPASSIMSNVGLRRWPSCISTLEISDSRWLGERGGRVQAGNPLSVREAHRGNPFLGEYNTSIMHG